MNFTLPLLRDYRKKIARSPEKLLASFGLVPTGRLIGRSDGQLAGHSVLGTAGFFEEANYAKYAAKWRKKFRSDCYTIALLPDLAPRRFRSRFLHR